MRGVGGGSRERVHLPKGAVNTEHCKEFLSKGNNKNTLSTQKWLRPSGYCSQDLNSTNVEVLTVRDRVKERVRKGII